MRDRLAGVMFFAVMVFAFAPCARAAGPLYLFTLKQDGSAASYDDALAAACMQGIINRAGPIVYVLSQRDKRPTFWLDVMTKDNRWLQRREQKRVVNLDALRQLAGRRLKGAIIWDPAVPATINVATTIAGVEDGVVLSPEMADRYLAKWHLPVLVDLRGKFTGAISGSAKNDAYRWAINEYLAKGRCSAHRLCLFEDSFSTRAKGDIGYIVTRDWAILNRAFVFDLSPWADEPPQDDPHQKPGTDLQTYETILKQTLAHSAGKEMTELTGFFAFSKYSSMPDHKSAHEGVATEWQTVWLISPYNCYQNTISSSCFNQSLHSQAPRRTLKQKSVEKNVPLENKSYVCVLMADYDSATPLYDFLPTFWKDPKRGSIPLMWGINPSLLETYPDVIAYYYSTASTNDTFASDASAAGYMNPDRIQPKYLPLFVRHNQKFFREADMSMAPMVLDQHAPTPAVKDAFAQFAPDGFATIIQDYHDADGKPPKPQVWKGMPVMELLNDTCNSGNSPDAMATAMAGDIEKHAGKKPGFYLFRIVWTNPAKVAEAIDKLRHDHPELNAQLVGPRTFFGLFKKSRE